MSKFMMIILLISLMLTSPLILAQNPPSDPVASSIDLILDDIEFAIKSNSADVESAFLRISKSSKPVSQLQRNRLMLLQAHHLIQIKNHLQAEVILSDLMQYKLSQSFLIRTLYFKGLNAYLQRNFEQTFFYLHQIEQYPKPNITLSERFDIIVLATDLHMKSYTFDSARGYTQRAISLARIKQSPSFMCHALQMKSNVYAFFKKFKGLQSVAKEALTVCVSANDHISFAKINVNLSQSYKSNNRYSEQELLLEQSIKVFEQYNSIDNLITSQLLLAEVLLQQNKIIEVDKIINKIFTQIKQRNVPAELVLAYRIKAMLFESLGLPDDAIHYFKQYLDAQNEINDTVRIAHIAYLKTRFESKIKRQSILINQIEQQNSQLVAKASTLINVIFLVVTLLVASLSFFCWTFFRKKPATLLVECSDIDQLTQLPLFPPCFNVAQHEFNNCLEINRYFCVICVNLDFMSAVNNSYSYDFGDILLQAFTDKIKSLIAQSGFLARVNGDDFIAFVSGNNPEEITQLVVDIHHCLEGIEIDRKKIFVSCSIGFSINDLKTPEGDLNLLIEQATRALRQAKFNGRNQWIKYQDGKIDQSLVEADYRADRV